MAKTKHFYHVRMKTLNSPI